MNRLPLALGLRAMALWMAVVAVVSAGLVFDDRLDRGGTALPTMAKHRRRRGPPP